MLQARQRVHPEGSRGATPPPPPEEAPSEPEAYAEDTEDRSSSATDSEIKQVLTTDVTAYLQSQVVCVYMYSVCWWVLPGAAGL